MLQAYYVAGGGHGKAQVLTAKGLKAWLDAEFDVFRTFARFYMDRLVEYSCGNPPGQGIHDCGTLDNKVKCMASGHESIPPELDRNLVMCTGMRQIEAGDDITGAAMLDLSYKDVFARPYTECSNQTVLLSAWPTSLATTVPSAACTRTTSSAGSCAAI